ncbi:ATP-grasp domain-containing protein [Paracraurococcus lichenis]|uniref:ATP-grasp domain-containing protein n=1 Tax=Paracraurococcus lichenis TaxID=3064888 RepID=A0ABT9DTT9_9PROT|nr:ATP-grasp domain-containing protein [Paracraurococcus sp. LOR1-02]MDO9707315.1 ATP-grasp domain-containing protein [Paracraurococcus sp. LOR1-02]
MTDTVLLTLGRLPKALDLARSFSRAGWRVVVAEPHRRTLTGISGSVARSLQVTAPAEDPDRYLGDLARIVREEGVSLVVPVSEEALHVAFLRPLLPAGVRLLAMPPETMLRLHDKHGFVRQAEAAGLTVPETWALDDPRARALAEAADVVVKPIHACSGRGVRRLPAGAPLPPPEPAIVQRLIRGTEHSTCTLAHQGRVQGTAIYRGTLMSGSVAVGFERVENPAIEAWVAPFVAATRWTGFIAFDLMLDAAGTPWGLECNPRTTSGLHFFAEDDLARAVLDSAHSLRFRPERRLQQFWSCLTETQHSFGDWPRFRANLRHLLGTRDVTWQGRDPLPLLTMPWTAWPIIAEANRRGVPFGEVATLDVGWSEPPAVTAGPAAPSRAA